jgi:hypothetical protein
MTTVRVSKEEILDVLSCAEDYGYKKPIILQTLTAWYGPITEAEIDAFAAGYTEEDGYAEEDIDYAKENITEIFSRWGKIVDA